MQEVKNIMSGTWGECWLNGEKIAETYGVKLDMKINKETVPMCGRMVEDSKIMNVSYTGTIKMRKVSSRMTIAVANEVKQGKDPRFILISKLADPDAYGAERVQVTGVSFDSVTLADWEAKVLGNIEMPFTFTDYEMLDTVEPQ